MKYFEFGQEHSELMVMLHGGGVSYLGMLPTAKKLAERYHVVLVAYDGFNPGDVVELFDGKASTYAVIKSSQDNIIVFETPVTADVVDKNLRPVKYIRTAEIKVTVKYEETAEEYDCVSFNPEASNYIVSRMQKSDLVKVACGAASAPAVKAVSIVGYDLEDVGNVFFCRKRLTSPGQPDTI